QASPSSTGLAPGPSACGQRELVGIDSAPVGYLLTLVIRLRALLSPFLHFRFRHLRDSASLTTEAHPCCTRRVASRSPIAGSYRAANRSRFAFQIGESRFPASNEGGCHRCQTGPGTRFSPPVTAWQATENATSSQPHPRNSSSNPPIRSHSLRETTTHDEQVPSIRS